MNPSRKLPSGLIARVAIQCAYNLTPQEGSFLFSGDTHRASDAAVSPCFADLAELFTWAKAHGWERVGAGFDAAYVHTPKRA